jgi:EmrB/QacA subfamily drug resistance transporter
MHDRSVYPLGKRRTLVVLSGTLLGMLLGSMNQTLTATALPTIVADLGSVGRYSWVFTAYTLCVTLTIPLYGKLSDVHGRRPVFAAAIVLFCIGSVVSGAASTMSMLVAGRAVQGIGAGGLVPLGFAVIGDLIAPRARGKWQALTGSVFACSALGAPALGGWITDTSSWRLVFFVGLPVAAVALGVIWFGFGTWGARHRRRIDWLGAALLTAGAGAVLFAVSSAGVSYPWSSPVVLCLLAAGLLLLARLALRERRVADPFLPVSLLRRRPVAAAVLALFALGAAAFGAVAYVPLFAQGVLRESATRAGVVLTPLMISWISASIVAGQLVSRTGRPRPVLFCGPPLIAAGFALLMQLGTGASLSTLVRDVAILGAGVGVMMQTLVVVVQNAAPRSAMGSATASAQFSRWIGSTLGVTAMGAVVAGHLGGAAALADPVALTGALHPAFAVGLAAAGLTLAAVLLLPETVLRARFEEPVADEASTPSAEAAAARAQ